MKSQKGSYEYDVLNNPPANSHVKLDNGNEFKTNAHGYVEELSFQPTLNKMPRDSRQTAVGKEGVTGDVGGHAQACSLGGTCDRFNLFPQNGNFNNSAYKKWENKIRNELEKGTKVDNVTIKFNRSTPSNPRPDSLRVTYNIGGVPATKDFPNMSSK